MNCGFGRLRYSCGMVCPQCVGAEKVFTDRFARRELKRYRRKGAMKSTRRLIDALKAEGVGESTLLDVGGGIGVIQLELLEAGARSAVDIDAAPAYLKVAAEEAARRGLADRITYRTGDFATMNGEIGPADIVTLDRVVCCYPDMPALIDRSTANATRLLGLVYPRAHWLMRAAQPLINAISRLRRCPFRFHLHPPAEIDRRVRAAGFEPRHASTTVLWHVVVYASTG